MVHVNKAKELSEHSVVVGRVRFQLEKLVDDTEQCRCLLWIELGVSLQETFGRLQGFLLFFQVMSLHIAIIQFDREFW